MALIKENFQNQIKTLIDQRSKIESKLNFTNRRTLDTAISTFENFMKCINKLTDTEVNQIHRTFATMESGINKIIKQLDQKNVDLNET